MRVLHIMNEIKFSGAELLLYSAASILLEHDQHVVLSTGQSVGEFSGRLKEVGYEIEHLRFEKSIRYFLAIRNIIRHGGFDVVHVHAERASFWHQLASLGAAKVCVRTVHNEFRFEGWLRVMRSAERRLASTLGVKHIACSAKVSRNERIRFGVEADKIDNWFDPKRIRRHDRNIREDVRERLNIDNDDFVIISIGNFGPAKNYETLIESLSYISPEIRFTYLVCGSMPEYFMNSVSERENSRIVFLGATDLVPDYLSASDLFLSASHFEGGQVSLLEAAAAGLSCVTTRVGLAEELEGYRAAKMVAPVAQEVGAAISSLASMPRAERIALGSELADFVWARFTPENGARAYLQLYRNLMDRT